MAVKSRVGYKKSKSKGGSGAGRVQFVPKSGITVRFLAGPEKWVSYEEYWDGSKYTIVTEENETEIGDQRTSIRYLAPVIDTTQNRVVAIKLPYKLAGDIATLEEFYAKKKGWAITDYDIELSKEGENMSTEYNAMFDSRSEIDLNAYELPDLDAILEEMSSPREETVEADIDDDTTVVKKKLLKKV